VARAAPVLQAAPSVLLAAPPTLGCGHIADEPRAGRHAPAHQ